MNTIQDLGQFCLFYSFMKQITSYCSSPLHISSTIFFSTDPYLIIILQCNNKLSKDWLHELSSSCLQSILSGHNGYLLCPITINTIYCQIRANTLYLQPLTVLYDFTKLGIFKNVVFKNISTT
jgi:hypothetical protein